MINASRSGPTFQRFSRQCGGTELSLAAVFLRAQLADEIGFERAGRVVPFQSFAVPVPQFETVLLLAVLVAEIIGLAGVPIGESQRTTRRQPEKASLFSLVGSRSPKVFIAVTETFDVILENVVLLYGLNAGQLHAVVATELGSLVPIGLFLLKKKKQITENKKQNK